ncbi:MAG TPA: 5'-3' exonuclease H3TH domain-containing protein [Candidatus Paceibacterota bacterium]|nr:5'-3' exonuclease H3TH domain-containing protein [Candidatus Paceibacterota bacterium]
MKHLLLIDANSIIHRSFHALPPLTTPEGKPSGAIYGIASILIKLWRENKPDYVAALYDRPEPTFRDKKYKEYKAQRPPAAQELIDQIIESQNLFHAFGVKTFDKPGYEADDLIATFAEAFKEKVSDAKHLQVVILTGDRDTLQLVEDDRVVVKTFNKGVSDTTIYDEKAVEEKYFLKPNQLIDYKALVGDASDNIKGVPGVGPKTAVDLIRRFGTVKDMFERLKEDPKLEAKYGNFKAEAELSEELVTLERHVPIEMPKLEDLDPHDASDDITKYFQDMGFITLLKRFLMNGEPEPVKPKRHKKEKQPLPEAKTKPKNPQTPLF